MRLFTATTESSCRDSLPAKRSDYYVCTLFEKTAA